MGVAVDAQMGGVSRLQINTSSGLEKICGMYCAYFALPRMFGFTCVREKEGQLLLPRVVKHTQRSETEESEKRPTLAKLSFLAEGGRRLSYSRTQSIAVWRGVGIRRRRRRRAVGAKRAEKAVCETCCMCA